MARYTPPNIDWLRRAGLGGNSKLTEAQIEEKEKLSPLGGYGYLSAKEKAAREQQSAMMQAEIERQNQLYMQQLLMTRPAGQQIGHHAGAGLMGLMGLLGGKGQAPQAAAPPQDDPEVAQFNQYMAEGLPEDVAMEMVGKGANNGAMMADAQAQRQERLKAEMEQKDLEMKVNDENRGYEHKPGYSEERDVVGPGGQPYVERWQLLRNSKEGGVWKVTSRGPKGGIQGTPGDFKGKADTSDTVQNFETAQAATASALDSMDKMEALVKENPNITGWSGRLIAKADDIMEGVKGLAGQIGTFEGKGDWQDIAKYDFGKLEKTAQGSEKLRALVLELAASRAAATEEGGRFSEGDIQRQIDQIGGQITNPRTMVAVLKQARESMVDNLMNKGRYMTVDGKPVGDQYKQQLEGFNKRIGRGTVVVTYPNGKTKRVPANHPSLKNLPEGYKVSE